MALLAGAPPPTPTARDALACSIVSGSAARRLPRTTGSPSAGRHRFQVDHPHPGLRSG
ncbi:hypothetical protein QJS66_09710 [Kocuria rhizophila]|nr:hypothetical protein QJS66_09710 [Kocuria rhizophila]